MNNRFLKVRFTNKTTGEATAGLVLSRKQFDNMTIDKLSRLYPLHEALKMHRMEVSKDYDSFELAFLHSFKEC